MTTTPAKPVKVHVAFTVEIDPADWALNYGTDVPAVIRADIKTAAAEVTTSYLRARGLNPKVTQTTTGRRS